MAEPHAETLDDESPFSRQLLRALFELAKQQKKQLLVVSLFSFLYTVLDLIQPLVYRRAINAVAGVFVDPASTTRVGVAVVHAQTPEQTFHTLLVSVILLFVIAVTSYYFYQRANYYQILHSWKG